jgi:5'-3' exonuclease
MRLHLVDGTFELFRAHYSKRPDHPLKATRGLVQSFLWLVANPAEQVTHVAVAFDNPIRSFRNDIFPPYKSDEGVPPELRAQFDTVETAVRALGIAVWSMREFEADDGLASGARRFAAEVDQVRIMTPDKDLGQCLDGDRVVMVDRRQNKVTDEAAFRARRGFGPRSMPDYLALTGDTADGIPGLAGFGDKSASVVIAAYHHLENIPDSVRAWSVLPRSAAQLAVTLAAHRQEALLYRTLATLIDTAPCAESLEELRFQGVPREEFQAWCDALGVQTMRAAPRRWRGT